jgi:predicted DNA-binding protein
MSKTESIRVYMSEEMKDKISKIAKTKELDESTLCRMWIKEKLDELEG